MEANMPKKYAEPKTYEEKIENVMARLGVEKFNYDWSRQAAWVEFIYKGQLYRFDHSVANAQAHGAKIQYGSDVFAQVVLTLEDLARMSERGIYDLQTWVVGMKALPAPAELPRCFAVLQFTERPQSADQVNDAYRRLSKVLHPDGGGTKEQFSALTQARDQALEYFKED
jgi:hypothetical protein